MKKNSKIHFWVETELKKKIERQAKENGLSVSEYCRDIIKENYKLSNLEKMMKKMIFLLENRKIYKEEKNYSNINLGSH
jgi:hypothetical protein